MWIRLGDSEDITNPNKETTMVATKFESIVNVDRIAKMRIAVLFEMNVDGGNLEEASDWATQIYESIEQYGEIIDKNTSLVLVN